MLQRYDIALGSKYEPSVNENTYVMLFRSPAGITNSCRFDEGTIFILCDSDPIDRYIEVVFPLLISIS